MEIYLVPFSLLDLVTLSPLYAYVVWYMFRRMLHKKRRFTGFMTWAFIIHASIIPIFWTLHNYGVFHFVESDQTSFDPVIITNHVFGFLITYLLFTGGITMAVLAVVKRRSV